MDNFDYKKHSLEQVKTWVRDALVSAEVSPQEIYDTIKGVVDEEYHYFKHHTGRCYDLLCLLNGNGKGHIKAYDEYLEKKENLICNKEDSSLECQKSWNDFWEENYYPEEVKDDGMRPWGHSDLEYLIANKKDIEEIRKKGGYEWTPEPEVKTDRVTKWILPVEVDGPSAEYFVTFPDDLLEAANLKEGDQIYWIDNGDGSYLLRKVTRPLGMDEC